MKETLLVLSVLILLIGCSENTDVDVVLKKETFKGEWAFTVDSVTLQCNPSEIGTNPIVIANGHKYGLTGYAATHYGDASLEDIWKKSPTIPGTRIDISDVRKLCEE